MDIFFLYHINSAKLLKFLIRYIEDRTINDKEERLMLAMFYYSFYLYYPEKEGLLSIEEGISRLLKYKEMKEEILAILKYNYNNMDSLEIENDFDFLCSLGVHSNYTTFQVLAALEYFNEDSRPSFR